MDSRVGWLSGRRETWLAFSFSAAWRFFDHHRFFQLSHVAPWGRAWVAQVPKAMVKALRPPGSGLWGISGVDLQGERVIVQVVVTDDL